MKDANKDEAGLVADTQDKINALFEAAKRDAEDMFVKVRRAFGIVPVEKDD